MTFRKKILLVDHEPRGTSLVRRALERTERYSIKEEPDSRRALKTARFFHPDLILFDIDMSHPRAAYATQELQADSNLAETPVVFLSVKDVEEGGTVSGGILSGYRFLANPVRMEDFVRCVNEILFPESEPEGGAV